MTRGGICLLILAVGAVAGPLDPAKSFIQGAYRAYTGLEFDAAECLSDSLQSDLLLTAEALTLDFVEGHSFAMLYSHLSELYEDLMAIESACGLTTIRQDIIARVAQEDIFEDLTRLEGFGAEVVQQILLNEWESAGNTVGEALAVLIPPAVETVWTPTPDATFFQRLDNFTAGLFYGFIPNPNPKKPVACLGTYNSTSRFFYQSANTIKGCIHLFISDCKAVRDLVPAAIINLQGLVLSCKLQDLYTTFKNLGDPTYWSQVAVAYYFNTQTINAKIADIKQCVMFQKWYPVGVDVGTIIRLIFNFKLT